MAYTRLLDGHLMRDVGDGVVVLGLWTGEFKCWLSNATDPLSDLTSEAYPYWPVLGSEAGRAIEDNADVARDHWDDYLATQQSYFGTPINPTLYPAWEMVPPPASDPHSAYLSTIPQCARQLAQSFGIFQWAVLEGIRYLDGFGEYVREPHNALTIILSLVAAMPLPTAQEGRLNRLRAIVTAGRS